MRYLHWKQRFPSYMVEQIIMLSTMKRFLALASVAMMLLLSGCKKEEQTLAGTKWMNDIDGGNVTLSFTSIQAAVHFDGGPTYYYSYEYEHPTVLMYPESSEESDDVSPLKGIISDNTMSVVNLSKQETIGIFTKK